MPKSVYLNKLRLTAAASLTDAAIHKKMFRTGFTTLIVSNEGLSETIKNEAKE